MASGKSAYLRNKLISYVFGAEAYTPPGTMYVALSTATWSASTTGTSLASTEPSNGAGYARISISNNITSWPTTVTGIKTNDIDIEFDAATGSWGTIQSVYFVDAATDGNILYGGDLYTAKSIASGDSARFSAGQITISEV